MTETFKDIQRVKKELEERRRSLEEKITQISQEKVTDDAIQDPGDQALSSTMETLRSSFQDAEVQEYKRIVRALEKIQDGTYGICMDCGKDISPKRLKLYPNASRCLVCQEIFEEQGG